jgi:hypothetical protein
MPINATMAAINLNLGFRIVVILPLKHLSETKEPAALSPTALHTMGISLKDLRSSIRVSGSPEESR